MVRKSARPSGTGTLCRRLNFSSQAFSPNPKGQSLKLSKPPSPQSMSFSGACLVALAEHCLAQPGYLGFRVWDLGFRA